MTDIERAKHLFQEAGLAFPTIPDRLAARLKQQDKWLFATRAIQVSPYDLQHYVHEFDGTHVDDYAILSHSGHGVNSYAIQYYLVLDPLRMFLHLGWGGVYMDSDATAAQIRKCFSLADQIVTAGNRGVDKRLTIVGSDFYGSYWSAPGHSRQKEIKARNALISGGNGRSERPAKVMAEVLRWVKGPPPNQPLQQPHA